MAKRKVRRAPSVETGGDSFTPTTTTIPNNELIKQIEEKFNLKEDDADELLIELVDRFESCLEMLEHPQHHFKNEVEEFLGRKIVGKAERENSKN